MDYSTLPHDPENPEGASPWASSPQHNRTSFGNPPTGDIPPSPLAPQSPYGEDGRQYGYMNEQDANKSQETHGENGEQPQRQSEQGGPQNPPRQQQQQHSQQRQEPQRYHHGGRQSRQHQPHYKLQAKVTGLERTGRKDPILRFDVYVRMAGPLSDHL